MDCPPNMVDIICNFHQLQCIITLSTWFLNIKYHFLDLIDINLNTLHKYLNLSIQNLNCKLFSCIFFNLQDVIIQILDTFNNYHFKVKINFKGIITLNILLYFNLVFNNLDIFYKCHFSIISHHRRSQVYSMQNYYLDLLFNSLDT